RWRCACPGGDGADRDDDGHYPTPPRDIAAAGHVSLRPRKFCRCPATVTSGRGRFDRASLPCPVRYNAAWAWAVASDDRHTPDIRRPIGLDRESGGSACTTLGLAGFWRYAIADDLRGGRRRGRRRAGRYPAQQSAAARFLKMSANVRRYLIRPISRSFSTTLPISPV